VSNDIGTMPGDPRPLGDSDYHANGKLKRVANPADGIIRTPAKSKAVTTPEKLERIKKVLEYRGRHLKGKAHTRGTWSTRSAGESTT